MTALVVALRSRSCRTITLHACIHTAGHDPVQVPDGISDLEATFTEPLAAACRILEQKVHLRFWGNCISVCETVTLSSHVESQRTVCLCS